MTSPTAALAALLGDAMRIPSFVVDWSGEDEPGDIARFAQRRADALGLGTFVWTPTQQDAATSGAARGDAVPRLMTAVDEALRAVGGALSQIETGADSYELLVTRETDAEALRELTIDNQRVIPVAPPAGEAAVRERLVTVVCPTCGAMNVWQLPVPGPEMDDGDTCSSCDRAFFTPEGDALDGVIVEVDDLT
ncbi:hypothetical protein [Microbacterium sp. ZW T5_56]|uniref:DUF6630 family protein n=1 Tax=Microbacterium sp. ZW T5_56 TaxID=3378081 RepID=UPI003852B0DC